MLWDDTVARGTQPHRTPGAGGRAGAERAASSVTVVPSRQRVRRELGKPPFNAMLQNPLRIFWFFFVPERL